MKQSSIKYLIIRIKELKWKDLDPHCNYHGNKGKEIKILISLRPWYCLEYPITNIDLPINAWQVKILTDIGPDWLWIDYLKL